MRLRKVWVCTALGACLLALSPFVIRSSSHGKIKGTLLDSFLAQVLSHTAIISNKKVPIPGYPKAFNPSLIAYEDGYLLSFRTRHRASKRERGLRRDLSFIGTALLDKEFRVIKNSVELLDIKSYSLQKSCTAEDARLLQMKDRLLIFFNDLPPSQAKGEYALYMGELVQKNGKFVMKEPAKLLRYSQAMPVEKNWSPFLAQEKLYVIYSDQPRIILEVDAATGGCREVVHVDTDLHWNWGEVRGGTPAAFVEDRLLTFFHSHVAADSCKAKNNTKLGRNYVMGAYTFDGKPPFQIRSMTSVPLGDLKDYTENNRHKVIFPGGMVIKKDSIYVAWGKNDKEIRVTTFNKETLLDAMEEKMD